LDQLLGNTHVFTGSMAVSGGLVVSTTSPELTVGATGVTLGNVITDAHNITGSIGISGSLTSIGATFNGDIIYNNAGNQNLIITSGAANNGRMYIYGAGNADIGFQASGSSWFLNSLGIGTSSPLQLLYLQGVPIANNVFSGIGIGDANSERIRIGYNTLGITAGLVPPQIIAGVSNLFLATRDIVGADIVFQTGAGVTEKMRITSGGNVGLGNTTSAWGSPFKVIQGGSYGQYVGFQTNVADMKLGVNHYYNSGYIYTTTDKAAQLNISSENGFQFNLAPSGTAGNAVTFTSAMSITSAGDVVLAGRIYTRSGSGNINPSFTTLFTMEASSTYFIVLNSGNTDGTFGLHSAMIDAGDLITTVLSGNNISSQIVGTDFQIRSNNGSTYGLTWTALRIK
jgi:hypothetical protein